MMKIDSVEKLRTLLRNLLGRVKEVAPVAVAQDSHPNALTTPDSSEPPPPRKAGQLKGQIRIAEDFAPDPEIAALFYNDGKL